MMPRQKPGHASDPSLKVSRVSFLFPSQYLLVLFCWWICVNMQNHDAWLPGSARNPEAYILKDQVLIFVQYFSLVPQMVSLNFSFGDKGLNWGYHIWFHCRIFVWFSSGRNSTTFIIFILFSVFCIFHFSVFDIILCFFPSARKLGIDNVIWI